LRREAAITGDQVLEALYAEVGAYPGVQRELPAGNGSGGNIVVPLRLRDHSVSPSARVAHNRPV